MFGLLNKTATASYTLKFGKYKGKSWNFVLRIDPDYLIWLIKQPFFANDLHYLKTGEKIKLQPPKESSYMFI